MQRHQAKSVALDDHLREMAELPMSLPLQEDSPQAYYERMLLALTKARLRIEHLKKSAKPDFSLIQDLETHDEELDAEMRRFYARLYTNATPEMYAVADRFGFAYLEHIFNTYQDRGLFRVMARLQKNIKNLKLGKQREMLVSMYHSSFVGCGVKLDAKGRKRIRDINTRLMQLSLDYENNLKRHKAQTVIIVKTADELDGLSEETIAKAQQEAESRGYAGKYALTLETTAGGDFFMSSSPVMPRLKDRKLRRRLWTRFTERGSTEGADNTPLVMEIARLRYEHAQLLGYKSHAHECAGNRMLLKVTDVKPFLDHLLEATKAAAESEFQDITAFARETDGIETVEPWDIAYYIEKMKVTRFGLDTEAVKEYLPVEQVLKGFFEHCKKLFDISFHDRTPAGQGPLETRVFEVFDRATGSNLGTVEFDLFSRDGKESGAWMMPLRNRRILRDGSEGKPIANISCNFEHPKGGKPALLTIEDVKVLFHEGGHALHELLTEVKSPTISGTNVDTDLVELPSIIQENWVTEPETLRMIGRHYETGRPMPRSMVKAISQSRNFMAGIGLLHHLHRCYLDVAWHLDFYPRLRSVSAYERSVLSGKTVLPQHGSILSNSFTHIFSGGYSFGYYGYEWSQRMADHAFAIFKRKGLYNRDLAKKFRKALLARNTGCGWTQFRSFSKRDPHPNASLRARGIDAASLRRRLKIS
ncbi:MAG: hypothetical protein EBQ96_05110 [Proteobacteria bacterium]|nr:hypothetical protein [Pseudomonadota bacterium]